MESENRQWAQPYIISFAYVFILIYANAFLIKLRWAQPYIIYFAYVFILIYANAFLIKLGWRVQIEDGHNLWNTK
jgi:hypothetical protein